MTTTTILSDNGVSSGSAGLKSTGGNDGTMILQTTTAGGTATTAVTIGTDQSVTFAQSANLPNTFGFKNRIINGAMMIDQRNAGAAFTNSVGTLYTIDRWMSTTVGSSVTTQQVTGSTGNNKALRLTGASGNADAQLSQKIESWNIFDLASQSVTVSFTLSGSSSGTVYLRRLYPTATDNYTSTTEPDSSIAINFTTTPTQYTATFTLSANANKGLWLIFDFGAVGAGVTRTLENVQLEKGSTATSFDYRPYGTELALCQRYFYKATIFNASTVAYYLGYYGGTNGIYELFYPVTMRATPTATISQPTQVQVYYTSGWTNVTIGLLAYNDTKSFAVYVPSDHSNNKLLQLSGGSTVPTASVSAEL